MNQDHGIAGRTTRLTRLGPTRGREYSPTRSKHPLVGRWPASKSQARLTSGVEVGAEGDSESREVVCSHHPHAAEEGGDGEP